MREQRAVETDGQREVRLQHMREQEHKRRGERSQATAHERTTCC